MQFAHELQREGKTFEMMLYPRTKHGVTDKKTVLHMQKTVMEFIVKNLQR